jgi:uncharacterized protein (TIGR03790 family)
MRALILALGLTASAAWAIGPHEILLLVNGASDESVTLGARYARERGIPQINLVSLDIPLADDGHARVGVTPAEFEQRIWTPAVNAVAARGIGDHILAWVFSTEFPVRVDTDPPVSVQGLVFARNRMPAAARIRDGKWESPLFGGPPNEKQAGSRPQTFDTFRDWLGEDMPIPSMMLGYTGERGNDADAVRACLERGRESVATAPRGTVYFVTNADVRSTCREWQYRGVVRELARLNVAAAITNALPVGRGDVIGLMTGAADLDPARGLRYRPGALGDHLTSAAAVFDQAHQTKVTAWIAAGATAAAGTVTEPMSIWMKFPHARLFVYYASGGTAIESYYQAVRCPMQTMVLGDPLAAPWSVRDEATVSGPSRVKRGEPASFSAEARSGDGLPFVSWVWLMDGRIAGRGQRLTLETSALETGTHAVRAVGRTTGLQRRQAFDEVSLEVL